MSEIKYIDGDIMLWGIINIIIITLVYLIWDLSRIKLTYTLHTYECLKCGYKYKSKNSKIVDLIMFLHRIICRRK